LHGPRVRAIIEAIEAGSTPDKYSYVDEKIYSAYDKIYTLSIDNSNYDVTILSQEEMN
jgi:simple sugar transport system substrate-binding protein